MNKLHQYLTDYSVKDEWFHDKTKCEILKFMLAIDSDPGNNDWIHIDYLTEKLIQILEDNTNWHPKILGAFARDFEKSKS